MEESRKALDVKYKLGETEVFCGKEIINRIPDTIKSIFEDGAICLIYDKNTKQIANELLESFKKTDYRIFAKEIDEIDDVPEYVRFVFGVGTGSVNRASKQLAYKLTCDYSLLFTAPTTDTILSGFSPKQVFIDQNVLINCPKECIASGWGIILSQPMVEFEQYFLKKVMNEYFVIENENRRIKIPTSKNNLVHLTLKLLDISYHKNGMDTAELMANILYSMALKNGEKPRLIGEYKFLCSSALSVFYNNILKGDTIDCLPPNPHELILDKMQNLTLLDRSKVSKRFDFFDITSYFRISYIIGEYRMDFLDRLSEFDLHAKHSEWRRIYTDAGYWLQQNLTSRKILKSLAIASELSGGLLGYAGAVGLTSSYI